MAGNKLNTKTKGREDKVKGSKSVNQNNEEGEELDFAMLRKPIPTSITGFAQARKIFDLATEELKDLLSNECDLMYECKVCRNIFRSLANFISHKRIYCKEKFNKSIHGHFVNINSTATEIMNIQRTEKGYQESLKQQKLEAQSNHMDDNDDRIPLTKDITTVYEKIVKNKGVYRSNKDPEVVLQKIPSSSVAVFQNMKHDECGDKMRTEVNELDTILSHTKAVLQGDGKFTIESSKEPENSRDHDGVIQISDDDDDTDSDILKCKICDLQFSTQKTLKFHMKYKHLESRLVYPCPDCLEIFSTSWSVYRHLFKVHRKTAAQIRRLRESIQAKAFKMNNRPAFYEKRKGLKIVPAQKITEEERLDQENQAWMDNMEGDGEVPRCGGCGRTFERRAALAAHTHTCQPRSRALARRPDAKKIEIQIRKDYNKSTIADLSVIKAVDSVDNKAPAEDILPPKPQPEEKPPENVDKYSDDVPMDIPDDEQKSSDSAESPEKNLELKLVDSCQPIIRLPFAMQSEKSNLAAFRRRIQPDIVFYKLLCKKCDKTLQSPKALFQHMADHVKWMRYACKLCNFKHYNFEHLPEHVKTVHKLKGDKDFYFSTVKAIDGTEAMIISKCLTESEPADEALDTNEASPESRRPSRCSSDSSRLSDDSSSSNTIKESGPRKRKMLNAKNNAKRKKEAVNEGGDEQKDEVTIDKVLKSIIGDGSCSSNVKTFEENSSDMDDTEEKISKRAAIEDTPPVTSRRPVRKRTKPKHEDFEYDLSNLLKMEAQGYRDSLSVTTTKTTQSVNTTKTTVAVTNAKTTQTKKERKVQVEVPSNFDNLNNLENLNKDCCGALVTLSKKAVDKSAAAMKTSCFTVYNAQRPPNIFVRPMIPRILSRSDKGPPKKDVTDDLKDGSGTTKALKGLEISGNHINSKEDKEEDPKIEDKNTPKTSEDRTPVANDVKGLGEDEIKSNKESHNGPSSSVGSQNSVSSEHEWDSADNSVQKRNSISGSIPAVVPIKFRRQSLEIIKNNPLISKNITDFTKAGMKTKILVIKPINRKKDGGSTVNSPLKFQTIKLKDPTKSSSDDKQPDQVMVVKVPKVPCATAAVSEKPVLVNANVVDIVNNHEITENKCKEKDIAVTMENKAKNENDTELVETDDNNQAVTKNSDEVSDITVKDRVVDSDKSESVEAVS